MKFTRVLIANRGEIAVRLIRACARLGLKSIAVYSEADANARHVGLADAAYCIGAAAARSSYLNGRRIIEVARAAGAEAVHPGYGFLAENAAFAQHCMDAGLVFVGPSARIIAMMGAKIEAKQIAERAGVQCLPGYHGADQSDATLVAEAEHIGAPLLIKASAGGGGRGMRKIETLEALVENLPLARQEAQAAYGDPALLLERYVEAARHIEVQILADNHGNIVHLFERDCSVQRNYQKVIEEAPAPNLEPALRREMLASAVKLAREIDYDSVGTVEFIVDAARNDAYFLEMNTRLQVEHPVTELVTGIDIAAWQLRVAGGQELACDQSSIECAGWAIEARVAAEDPARDYRPATGTIKRYREPDIDELRIDSGVGEGDEVTPYYDSMLAKLIVHAPHRDAAICTLREALSRYRIGGVGVNTAFLRDVLACEPFRSGNHLTNCLAQAYPNGWHARPVSDVDLAHAALACHLYQENTSSVASPWATLGAWRLGERSGRDGVGVYFARHDGDEVTVAVHGRAGNYRIECDGETILTVARARCDREQLRYDARGQRHRVELTLDGSAVTLHRDADAATIAVLFAEQALLDVAATTANNAEDAVFAPSPGLITEIMVQVGESVAAGQPVVVMEAMKLLQQLSVPVGGVVRTINYQAGDIITSGDCLLTIEPTSKCNE